MMPKYANERVTMRLDAHLLELIDGYIEANKEEVSNRSEFMRKAAVEYLTRRAYVILGDVRVCIDLDSEVAEVVDWISLRLKTSRESVCKMLIALGLPQFPVGQLREAISIAKKDDARAKYEEFMKRLKEFNRP